jgi:hypothetical protein
MTISAQAIQIDETTHTKFLTLALQAQIDGDAALLALNSKLGKAVFDAMNDPSFRDTEGAKTLRRIIAQKVKEVIDDG